MPFEKKRFGSGGRFGGSGGRFGGSGGRFGGGRGGDRGGFGGRGGFGDRREGGFGGRPSFGGSDEVKPVNEGEVHTVTITETSQRGDGVARIKNFVIFVPGTKSGDTVKIKIKEVRGKHAVGEVIGEGEASESETKEETKEATEEVAEETEAGEGDEEKEEEEEFA